MRIVTTFAFASDVVAYLHMYLVALMQGRNVKLQFPFTLFVYLALMYLALHRMVNIEEARFSVRFHVVASLQKVTLLAFQDCDRSLIATWLRAILLVSLSFVLLGNTPCFLMYFGVFLWTGFILNNTSLFV